MRRASIVLVVSALTAAPVAGAAGSRHAALRITRAAPLTVHGSGFGRFEHVRLLVRGPSTAPVARRATAAADGTFDRAFASVRVGHCAAVRITAVGAAGSRATLTRHPATASCNPG
jgi:hypothetical protein